MKLGSTVTEIARFTISPSAAELVDLRHQVRGDAVVRRLSPAAKDDLILLLSELATNAIEAARPGSPVTVEVSWQPASVTVAVENFGTPFRLPARPRLPDSTDMRGRGLAIAAALSTAIHAEHHDGRTRVMATRELGRTSTPNDPSTPHDPFTDPPPCHTAARSSP